MTTGPGYARDGGLASRDLDVCKFRGFMNISGAMCPFREHIGKAPATAQCAAETP